VHTLGSNAVTGRNSLIELRGLSVLKQLLQDVSYFKASKPKRVAIVCLISRVCTQRGPDVAGDDKFWRIILGNIR